MHSRADEEAVVQDAAVRDGALRKPVVPVKRMLIGSVLQGGVDGRDARPEVAARHQLFAQGAGLLPAPRQPRSSTPRCAAWVAPGRQ